MVDELEEQMVARAEELTEEKKGDEAVETATELSKIDPNDAIVWFVKGKAHYIDRQFDDALACFSKAAEIDRENPAIWHMMGYCLITMNNLPKAEECLEYVKAMQPANAEAICALGICQVMQEKTQAARPNFDDAIAINKKVAIHMFEHFYENYFSLSKTASAGSKAMIERVLETIKLVR
ncbi:MAG: tetratricopeptide repeat protein [Candidatus Micrarchaeota archaeon]|nr:tetratricopeptide repeat protein [Candidatus Micrarchaeota archaeon]